MKWQQSVIGDLLVGSFEFFLTSALVLWGIIFASNFLQRAPRPDETRASGLVDACFHFDAWHYADIVEHGYSYDFHKRSTVAFFPGYPLTAEALDWLTGWDSRIGLLVLPNLMLLASYLFFSAYLRSRCVESVKQSRLLVLALFGLAPASFFFRMPYSESTFLFLCLGGMVGLARRWPLAVVAILAGAATATRPVGVALTMAFLVHIVFDSQRGPIKRRLMISVAYLPLACWGLIAYMGFQYLAYDAPLGFAQTQEHWTDLRGPHHDIWDKIPSLVSGEPIWGTYVPDHERYWQRLAGESGDGIFSMYFWNPIFFVGTAGLIFVGVRKRWLTAPEIVLSVFLLAIPYFTRAYEMCMASQARFAAVVFPAYIVLGRLLGVAPAWVTWTVIGMFSVMLMTWTALYASGHFFF